MQKTMRSFITLVFFLTSCSVSLVQDVSNAHAQDSIVVPSDAKSDSTRKLSDSMSETWQVRINDSQVRTAFVMKNGKTPNGEAQTILTLQFGPDSDHVTSISYIVRDSNKITGFDFDGFEGPYASASKKKLIEFRATSPDGNLSFRDSVAGWFGGVGEPDAFVFGTGTTKQDKIMRLARMVAKGSTEVTVIVHDYRDYSKTIETAFPAIDASSDVAQMLNGCQK